MVDRLEDAVADCVLAAGTSARSGGLFRKQSAGTPCEILPSVVAAVERGPIAIVFGPERTGLRNEEVALCHYLIHLPADPSYPALNLAQAVGITLYELRKQWLARGSPQAPRDAPAPIASQEHMFGQLQQALEEIHFLYGPKAESLMHALRHLIARALPSEMEVDVLRGLARQIHWFVHHGFEETQR
jgi:TrmH family RNA methyltransferase